MRVTASPWVRDRLTPAALDELRAAPDKYQLSISRGRSGFGATLIERHATGYTVLANVNGYDRPDGAIEACMDAIRPLLRPVLVGGTDA